jgi:putative hydrolase of the HAD superfamily
LKEFKWLLFDLGGVLVEYVGAAKLKSWMNRPVNDREFSRLWLFSPAVRAFESGRMSPIIFAYNIIEELNLDIQPDVFMADFPDFVSGYFPGAEELLSRLSARHPLAMLSNTNSPQWEKLCRNSRTDRLFRKIFLSFKTGLLKPDSEAFLNVIESLGCAPGDIAFFDDNPDNVRGALETGINAIEVKGFEDMREIIRSMGVLE